MSNQQERPGGDGGRPSQARRLGRRRVITGGAAATAAFFVAHATGDYRLLSRAAARGMPGPTGGPAVFAHDDPEFDDEPFDPIAVEDGSAGWFPSRYGAGDELGALNEITPQKTLDALDEVKNNRNRPPKVYNLGELMEPGIPAFGDRVYEQTRVGPNLGPDFAGDNGVVGMEERITTTYQIATQVDGLPHIGVRTAWYNGFTSEQLIAGTDSGVNHLGQHLVDPFITRGILLDVLSVKVAQGDGDALGDPVDGKPILANSYRITVEDLVAAMRHGRTGPIEPGDVVLIRTGWTHLFSASDPVKRARYLATEPGIYLREARWLAHHRPAIVASDTWALEVLPAPAPWTGTQLFPVHQELITHHGIRIGEAFRSEELAADGVHRFMFFYTPQRAKGATASNAAPAALGQPWPGRR